MCAERAARLRGNLREWEVHRDVAIEEQWMRDEAQLLLSPDYGHDLTSVARLLEQHHVRS